MAYTTNHTLLDRIRHGDAVSWDEFYLRYAPFVRALARKNGFFASDADELVQRTMISIFERDSVMKYDPSRGKFRGFLYAIIRNKIRDMYAEKSRTLFEPTQEETAEDPFDAIFSCEYAAYLTSLMLDELRGEVEETTFEAFQLVQFEGYSPQETADALHLSAQMVYTIRSRCLKRLSAIAERLKAEDPELSL